MTKEEMEVWEKYSAACLVGLMSYGGGLKVHCEDAAKYADQMLVEWRKRKGIDSPYRD